MFALTLDPQLIIAIVVPAVLGLVWLLRLEGRINTMDEVVKGLRKDVTYIRNRIDAALGQGYVHHRSDDE